MGPPPLPPVLSSCRRSGPAATATPFLQLTRLCACRRRGRRPARATAPRSRWTRPGRRHRQRAPAPGPPSAARTRCAAPSRPDVCVGGGGGVGGGGSRGGEGAGHQTCAGMELGAQQQLRHRARAAVAPPHGSAHQPGERHCLEHGALGGLMGMRGHKDVGYRVGYRHPARGRQAGGWLCPLEPEGYQRTALTGASQWARLTARHEGDRDALQASGTEAKADPPGAGGGAESAFLALGGWGGGLEQGLVAARARPVAGGGLQSPCRQCTVWRATVDCAGLPGVVLNVCRLLERYRAGWGRGH